MPNYYPAALASGSLSSLAFLCPSCCLHFHILLETHFANAGAEGSSGQVVSRQFHQWNPFCSTLWCREEQGNLAA